MNKRQIKKKNKMFKDRFSFFKQHISCAGKTEKESKLYKRIAKACNSKRFKSFKSLKKMYGNLFIGIDFGYEKDYSIETTMAFTNGKFYFKSAKLV